MYEAKQHKDKVIRRIDSSDEMVRPKRKIDQRTMIISHNSLGNNYRNNSIQLYRQCNNRYKISENCNYATDDENKHLLYLNNIQKAQPPVPYDFFIKIGQERDCDIYQPKATLISGRNQYDYSLQLPPYYGANDCGYYAGALAYNTANWQRGEGFRGMRCNEMDLGVCAAPTIGEAYFIRPSVIDKYRSYTEARHHVATVVAQDGTDRITSEADCGDQRPVPYFEMYGTKTEMDFEKEQTFAWRNKRYFNSKVSNLFNNLDAQVYVLTKAVPFQFVRTK